MVRKEWNLENNDIITDSHFIKESISKVAEVRQVAYELSVFLRIILSLENLSAII
jgi:hypothetical protein